MTEYVASMVQKGSSMGGRVKKAKMKGKTRRSQGMEELPPEKLLSPKEIEAMLSAAGSLRNRCLIAVQYECGVRIHEVCALKLRHVTVKNTHFRVWFAKVKGGCPKHYGYVAGGAPILREWLGVHPFKDDMEAPLLPTFHRRHMHRVAGGNIIKMAARRAGIKRNVTSHMLRHSRATHLLASGMNEAQVKALLGWSQGSPMLSRYSHLTSVDAEGAALRFEGLEIEIEPPEKVDYDNPKMPMVVPMVRAPGQPVDMFTGLPPSLGSTNMKELAKAVAKELHREAAMMPPPAWVSTPEAWGDAVRQVLQLQEELRQQLKDLHGTLP